MSVTSTTKIDLFPLAHFERALVNFQPPATDFDPDEAWVNTYDLWECSQGQGVVGALRIERSLLGEGRARLEVDFRKRAVGGSHRAHLSIECCTDELATPIRWQGETKVYDAQGAIIEDLCVHCSGEVQGGLVRLNTDGIRRTVMVGKPFTLDWCLFDAVQRLPGSQTETLKFTLLDRVSHQIKSGQRLAFRAAPTVELGGKRTWREEKQELPRGTVFRPVLAREGGVAVSFRCYEQTGQGIVPIVYWVDQRGRLLFALAGIFGYIYNPEAQP